MSRKIEDLVPEAQKACRDWLARCEEAKIHPIIHNTLRTHEEHAAIYAQGRESLEKVNAMRKKCGLWPLTEIENRKPISWSLGGPHTKGIAWDFHFESGGHAVWESPDYRTAGMIAVGMGLEWGGTWHQQDCDHIQIKD